MEWGLKPMAQTPPAFLRQYGRVGHLDVAAREVCGRYADPGLRRQLPRPTNSWEFSSDVCKHCEVAGCLEACPTGALVRTEFGGVFLQPDICNGCAYCVVSCPFGVVQKKRKTAAPSNVPSAPIARRRGSNRLRESMSDAIDPVRSSGDA